MSRTQTSPFCVQMALTAIGLPEILSRIGHPGTVFTNNAPQQVSKPCIVSVYVNSLAYSPTHKQNHPATTHIYCDACRRALLQLDALLVDLPEPGIWFITSPGWRTQQYGLPCIDKATYR